MGEGGGEGASLALTPTWAVATVTVVMIAVGSFFNASLEEIGERLHKAKKKALLLALETIKEELMIFGLLSLLMGHWIELFAKICIKSTSMSSRFYPCALEDYVKAAEHIVVSKASHPNTSFHTEEHIDPHDMCPEGQEPFVSFEGLSQLHRLMFVLGFTHVFYGVISIALAMFKIYSWRTWENIAEKQALQNNQDSAQSASKSRRIKRLSTFILHQASHPWSQHKVLVWVLCFMRQFWSSINQADYMALRFGFITTHQLPMTYNFHNYMLRSLEDEFSDIVGISAPLWVYAIVCIMLDFHGTQLYFWLSFFPAMLVLIVGTKLHRVVVKLAVEIVDAKWLETEKFHLRDELFWFGKPELLLQLIHLICFQNAFEMSTYLWSLWEIGHPSCFMGNKTSIAIRLTFGVVSQFWCSFVTFPLYVLITQMSSHFSKSVVSENVRKSLHGWHNKVKARQSSSSLLHGRSSVGSFFSIMDSHRGRSSSRGLDRSISHDEVHNSHVLIDLMPDYASSSDSSAHDESDTK